MAKGQSSKLSFLFSTQTQLTTGTFVPTASAVGLKRYDAEFPEVQRKYLKLSAGEERYSSSEMRVRCLHGAIPTEVGKL